MIPGRGTNANVDEAMNILPKKRDLLDAMRGSNVYNTNNAGSRNLQSSFCTLGDIESDLEEDFGFYTRAFENATGVSCDTRYSDTCITTIVTLLDDSGTNTSSFELEKPCSTCVFSYPKACTPLGECDPTGDGCLELQAISSIGANPYDGITYVERSSPDVAPGNVMLEQCTDSETPEYCTDFACDVVSGCLDGGDTDNITSSRAGNSFVKVCREVGRTDSFATLEFQQRDVAGTRYLCQAENRKRTFTSTYTLGVTNFRETTLTMGQKQGEGDVEGRFDTCEMAIDGVECNSCEICGEDQNGLLDVDCTNIFPNATTSCDSFLDLVLYGIDVEQKFMVLQEGFVPPTPSPTTSPTKSPNEFIVSGAASNKSFVLAPLAAALVWGIFSSY